MISYSYLAQMFGKFERWHWEIVKYYLLAWCETVVTVYLEKNHLQLYGTKESYGK